MAKKSFELSDDLDKRLAKYKEKISTSEAAVFNIAVDDFLRERGY